MKTFEETKEESYIKLNESDFQYLSESERGEVQEALKEIGDVKDLNNIDEGLFGKILGGLTGFLAGPAIGKVIANALGINRGVIYDMLTSRLAGAALGAALSKYIGANKNKFN